MTKRALWFALPGLVILLLSAATRAQDLEPRSYTNLPINQTWALLGYIRSEGDLSPTPTSALQDAELKIDVAAAGVSHSFALAGSAAKVDVLAARVCYEGSALFRGDYVDGQRCEYGDPKIKLTWNFYGAPALELEDFSRWDNGLVVGSSLQVSVPVGTYTSDHLINAGTNRWMVRPGIGLSFHMGNWYIDAMTSARFFEDNNNYFEGTRLEQDPIYALQSHLIYVFGKGRWLALNANAFYGGESSVNGTKRGDDQNNSRLGLTFSMPITRRQSIQLSASNGIVTRVGNDFESYGIFWLYRF